MGPSATTRLRCVVGLFAARTSAPRQRARRSTLCCEKFVLFAEKWQPKEQRVEYWRWRIFDKARNRWNDTQHLMTETDALLHHRRATKIEGSREVRDPSEPDEGPDGRSIWRQRSP
jgi:hypothetical protein